MIDEINYSGANVDFLNRSDGAIKRTIMYPITRIELLNFVDGEIVNGAVYVAINGKWELQQ